jgi:putative RNA 2'-phosphotransferase
MQSGLQKKSRQHVHLSADIETAASVGKRHGSPIVLRIDAKVMYNDGHKFFLSVNGVWLTDEVPARYLEKMDTVNLM